MIRLLQSTFTPKIKMALAACSFSTIQAEKTFNKNKPALKLLICSPTTKFSLEYLQESKQQRMSAIIKMLLSDGSHLSLGEFASAMVISKFQSFDYSTGATIFMNNFLAYFKKMNNNVDSFQLHKKNYLFDFIQLMKYVETHAHHEINRAFLVFLANYHQQSQQLTERQKNYILQHLSSRGYILKSLLQSTKKMRIDQAEYHKVIKSGCFNTIQQYFQHICCILSIILSVSHHLEHEPKLKEHKGNQISAEAKQEIIEAYFSMLENEQIRPLLLNPSRVDLLLLEPLFKLPQYKFRYLKIFESVFTPTIFHNSRLHKYLEMYIFDRLYTYYTLENGPMITHLLDLYTNCALGSGLQKHARMNYSILIKLCGKHQYVNVELIKIIVQNYLRHGPNFTQNLPYSSIRRNKLQLINKKIIYINDAISLLKLMQENKEEMLQKKILLEMIEKSVDSAFITSNECNSISVLDSEQMRERMIIENKIQVSFLEKYRQLIIGNNQYRILSTITASFEKLHGVTCLQHVLKKCSYSVNLRLNFGAQFKSLFFLLANSYGLNFGYRLEPIISRIFSLPNLLSQIKVNAAYPGLLQYFLLVYSNYQHIGKGCFNINELKPEIMRFNQLYEDFLTKDKLTEGKLIRPELMEDLEHLNVHLRVLPSFYSSISEDAYVSFDTIHKFTRMKQLRKKFKSSLLLFAQNFPNKISLTAFYIDYPYIADFLILTFSKRIVILIVSAHEKEMIRNREQQNNLEKKRLLQEQSQKQINKTEIFFKNNSEICYDYFSSKKEDLIFLISSQSDIQKFIQQLQRIVD